MDEFLAVENPLLPQILMEERDFLVVYKAPRMHSVPLVHSPREQAPRELVSYETILEWCVLKFPEIADLSGRRPGEGGLIHRLDYETQGLMLFARTHSGMEALLQEQKEGRIEKEYSALTEESEIVLPGFPELPPGFFSDGAGLIKSAFRPYGPGRKAVRPVISGARRKGTLEEQYFTEIVEERPLGQGIKAFRIRIRKGFRHQIRNHLAWIGRPILNDALYGGTSYGRGFLGLRASSLTFTDPSSGRERTFSISPFGLDEV